MRRLTHDRDEELETDWRDGAYPYRNLLRRSTDERHKFRLQVERLELQSRVKETSQRVVIVFEGPDAAGKDLALIGKLDPLIVGRGHVVYERGERPQALI